MGGQNPKLIPSHQRLDAAMPSTQVRKTLPPPGIPALRRLSVRVISLAFAAAAMAFGVQAQPAKATQFYDEALRLYERNDLAGTVLQLKNALQADQKMLAAHLLLGRVLLRNRELKAAEAALEEALKQGVSRAEVIPLLGQVYLQLGEARKVIDSVTVTGMPPNLRAELLTLRGSAHAMMGNLSLASESFAEARKADPLSAAPLIAEAPILLRFGERDKARGAALKATELAPSNGFGWYQLGNVQHALGDVTSALASFDKAVALNPKHADAHVSRATALLTAGRRNEAEKVLQMLKEQKVAEPRASWLRGMLAQEKGASDIAKKEFTDAINLIDPMAPAVRNGSEPLLLAGALSHRALGNREKTREYLDALLSRNSRHVAGQMLMASVLIESQDYLRAMPVLEGLLRVMPDNTQVQYMIGTVYLARKQYGQATEFLEKAASKGGSTAALRDLSFSQFGLGQDKAALANLERAYAKNPSDLRAGIELAVVYARVGQAAKAVKTAESLVKLDPDNLAMLNFLGNVKGRLGDKKGTREAYKLALAKDPKFRPVIMNMSWLDMEEGLLDDARFRLSNHLKEYPKDPDVLFQLGVLEQQMRRPNEAMSFWTQADAAQAKDPRPGVAIVELRLSLRQNEAALAAAKSLAAKYPEVLQVQLLLARAHLQMDDRAMARQALQDAAKLAGNDPGALVGIGRLQLGAGNPDGAAYAAAKALQSRQDDVHAMTLNVEIAARRGSAADVDKAMAQLQSKHPTHGLTLTTAGHIAFSRGQFAKAASHYRTVFEREPSTPMALTLTQALLASKEPDKALVVLEGWAKRVPKDGVALRALAEIQMLNGKSDAARRSFASVVEADPSDPSALAAYARALHTLKDKGALVMAEKAYKLAPQNVAYADIYGWILVEMGDADSGIRVLREARLRDPANGLVRWHLAAGLAKGGRKAEARDELQAAIASKVEPPPGVDLAKLKAELAP